jgi:hypothetical membrane protein
MTSRYPASYVSAILTSISYLVFSALAYIQYPPPFSPSANWLSDLGNETANVLGARFYNTGIILTGSLLLVWFLGLSEWRIQGPSPQNWLLLVTKIAGTMGALSLIMSAVYPINMYQQHSFWSHAHFMMLAMGFGFSVASLRYHPRFPRLLLYLGTTTAVSPLFVLAFGSLYFLEWVTVGLFLAYVLSVGFSTRYALRPQLR